MERQATQPAAVPTGRKRRRVSKKQKQEEDARAQALDKLAIHPPTSELVIALNALPKAADLTPLSTPSPTDQSVNDLMEGTLKDYEEECVEEGTFHSDPATEVGEWDIQDLDQMDTQLNQLLYGSCPFHPHRFLECVNPQSNVGPLRFKCSQEGCPVYLFEDTREVMMEALKEDTHPQVHARVKRGELKCRCGLVPKMKLSRTAKNYNKVFFSCGSFLTHAKPCGYFQWLHGPLWCPREQAQPTLRRWVKDTPPELQYKLQYKKECLPVPLLKGKGPEMEGSPPWEMHHVERPDPDIEKMRRSPWMNQFGESIKAQEREYERRRHLHKNFGSMGLF